MKAKRFWKEASVDAHEDGYSVLLDGRPVRTPSKTLLVLPTHAMAAAIASEWNAVEDEINPEVMPVTRAANSALDKVIPKFDAIVDMLAEYGGTDLLCYRSVSPQALQDRQAVAWDPILAWAKDAFDAPLLVTTGVMPVLQPQKSLDALRDAIAGYDAFELAAVHDLITLPGSLIVGLAVANDHLTPKQAWDISHIDEAWQDEVWGADDSATQALSVKKDAFFAAKDFLNLSKA